MTFPLTQYRKILGLTAVLLIMHSVHAEQTLMFSNAWSPEAPPVAPVMAGYFTVENSGKTEILITAISSPQFENIEIHRTLYEKDMAKMRWQPHIHVPAGKRVELKPGGKHLMMFKPKQRVKNGDTIELRIDLSDNTQQTIKLRIKK